MDILVVDAAADRLGDDLAAAATAAQTAMDAAGRRRWRQVRDPDTCKHLERLVEVVADFQRLVDKGLIDSPSKRRRLTRLLSAVDLRLQSDAVTEEGVWVALYEAQLLLVELADDDVVCGLIEAELHWKTGETSWLTWDALFGDAVSCPAVDAHRRGDPASPRDLAAARNRLLDLYRARHDDALAHRGRVAFRRKNLAALAATLAVLLPVFVVFSWWATRGTDAALALQALTAMAAAGALGAAVSGTVRARDQLTRQADIRLFRDGLPAQLLVGAIFGVLVVLLLRSKVVTLAELPIERTASQIAVAFVAGFSEPFAVGTVGRAARLGSA